MGMRGPTELFEYLTKEYADWQKAQSLMLGSADEHLTDQSLTIEQRVWLADFTARWDAACKIERDEMFGLK